MDKGKKERYEISELFMAKAGWDRCFYGTITRSIDETGNPVVRSKIKVNDGYIYSMATDQKVLGEKLDELVLMILNESLHSYAGVTTEITETTFFFN